MHCGYNFNKTCIMDIEQDCNAIYVPPSQQNNMQLILPFNDNNILCEHDFFLFFFVCEHDFLLQADECRDRQDYG